MLKEKDPQLEKMINELCEPVERTKIGLNISIQRLNRDYPDYGLLRLEEYHEALFALEKLKLSLKNKVNKLYYPQKR